VERFIGVKYPLKHLKIMRKRVILTTICGVWILAVILSAVPLLLWPEIPRNTKPYSCGINLRMGHVIVASVGIFHIPAITMVVFYYLIYR
jgi:hypothetical protein